MASTELNIRFLSAGCCYQDSRFVLPGSPGARLRFPAMFARIRHPRLGVVLYDTGYAPRVLEQCGRLPERFLTTATRIEVDDTLAAKSLLSREGIAADVVKHVILTHFHADHVGGLADFPGSILHLRTRSLERFRAMGRWSTMRHGVVSSLLPVSCGEHRDIDSAPLVGTGYEFFPEARDLFEDGSVLLVDLPGHAEGQFGALLTGQGGRRFFLVTDACWVESAYREFRMPSAATRLIHHDFPAYRDTLRRLHAFHREYPDVVIVPSHCEATLDRLRGEGF